MWSYWLVFCDCGFHSVCPLMEKGKRLMEASSGERQTWTFIHWKDWCWSWSSSTLPTWCEELTHLKRPWCWERLKVGGEGDGRGWDGWMASPTQWTSVWVSSGSWWWTGRPGVLRFMGSQRVGHNWVTELNWCVLEIWYKSIIEETEHANIHMWTYLCLHNEKSLRGWCVELYFHCQTVTTLAESPQTFLSCLLWSFRVI